MRTNLNLLFLITGMAFPRSSCIAQAPPTIQQSLAAHGIGLSQHDLLNALHSQDENVRGMAAMQLAEDGSQSAAAAIEQELARQSTRQATFNLANALEVLGDHQGTTTMARLCTDTSVPVDLRMSVQSLCSIIRTAAASRP